MNKRDFKNALEDIIFEYFHYNRNKKDLPDSISFDYNRGKCNKESRGELVFRTSKKDTLFKIKAIDYRDEQQ